MTGALMNVARCLSRQHDVLCSVPSDGVMHGMMTVYMYL